MFDGLTERFNTVFKKLRGQGKMTDGNIQEALREVRVALLEADVNYRVVKDFVAAVKEKAVGKEVLLTVSPGQQLIKIVNDELVALMGGTAAGLELKASPPIVYMVVGLQGSGKTTTIGKLGLQLKDKQRRPLLVPADIYRPAAILQLETIAGQVGVECFKSADYKDPVQICLDAVRRAKTEGFDVVLVDTAGRLHVDEKLMAELKAIKARILPHEILLVADSMTGQDAVNVAKEFNEQLELTGVVLTKMDGDARGGAALSIRSVTGKPIKLVGMGEKLTDLEVFHPDRMASRILGMGDIVTLVEKAQATFDQKKAEELEKKLRKNAFTLEDFRDQLRQMKKLGSMEDIIAMIPGMQQLKKAKGMMPSEKDFTRIEAIIDSMTKAERADHAIINASRRKRIAKGSGTSVEEVNKLLKNYVQAQKMIKQMNKSGLMRNMRQMMPF